MKKILSFALSLIFLLAIPLTAQATQPTTPTGIPLSEIEIRINELVANYMHEFTPGLAVAIVKDGEIIFSGGYGYANIEQQIPVDPAVTTFHHASISKLFVYVSVMQLVEQGLLDLDADIHTYLSENFSRQLNFRYTFTMRDLLNHSAGFAEFVFNSAFDASTVESSYTLREKLLASQPNQIYIPGTAKAYSNFGIALAGYVVSHVSGMDYTVYERVNILDPLGMSNTQNQPDWIANTAFLQNRAVGYLPDNRGGFNKTQWTYLAQYPAGSLVGTAEDLARFAIALMPPQTEPGSLFNSRATLDLMLSPSYSNPRVLRGTHHGFITYDGIYPGIGHSGGLMGFNTQFVLVPSKRLGVITLSNASGGGNFNEKILELILGNSRDTVPPSPLNLPDAATVAGTYVTLRRHQGNVMEMVNGTILGTDFQIVALDENTITLSRNLVTIGHTLEISITYRQVAPYLFRAVSAANADSIAFARAMYELYFVMEDGQPVRMSTSGVEDATPQTFSQSMAAFIGGMVIYWISVIFFLVTPIVLLVKFLRSKNKTTTPFNRISTALIISGTLIVINLIVYDIRFFTQGFPFLSTAVIIPHIWINYVLTAISAVVLVVSIAFWNRGPVTTKRRVLYIASVTFLTLKLFILWQWNYFVMM